MSTRTLTGRSALAWTFLIVAALCCGVRAAPEAFHHRQGDSAVIIPPVDLHELEKLGLTENTEQVSNVSTVGDTLNDSTSMERQEFYTKKKHLIQIASSAYPQQ